MTESIFDNTAWNKADEEASYTRLSVLAVLAFIFGLLSFLDFFSFWFAFIGVAGIVLSFAAVWNINRSEGALTGLSFAQLGLACSIISFTAVLVLWPAYHYGIRKEADRFFRLWFQIYTDNSIPVEKKIPLAMGMNSLYWSRPIMDDLEKWWTTQYDNKFAHHAVHQHLDNKLVRVMLELKNKAEVSYYKTLSVNTTDEKDTVETVYAVTFPADNGEKKTFFLKMTGERRFPSGDVKSAGWTLAKMPEIFTPEFKK
ncbi:hypothetical protein FACS189427_01970 [Planctomycetales bacterium]|nr:hypothetical protein FACS189427_01970 [Planctomycetales bacterium]